MVSYNFSGSIKFYTVATGGTYKITAYGGQGGRARNPNTSGFNRGGFGAEIGGDFGLTAGEVIEIVVGGSGGANSSRSGGGGGGSFVFEVNGNNSLTTLVIAGGGGGAAFFNQGGDATNVNAGTSGGGTNGGGGGTGGFGGSAGGGTSGGGGGSGINGNGASGSASGGGAGFTGGSGANGGGGGGFGGGGGAGGNGAGGGGGYSGGGGGNGNGYAGGGGGSYLYSSATNRVLVSAEHTGAGLVTLDLTPCYCRGTLILTSRGEVPVESLRIGDRVVTVGGFGDAMKPIVWIGHTPFDATRHPRPQQVWPIRIRAGAFADGLPKRDLLVSPAHAFLIDGFLMQAASLANGATIFQDRTVARGEYYHVELANHDILLAEGVPAESFLDNGNRRAFANEPAFRELYPDFSPKHWTDTCFPLTLSGPALAAAKARLLAGAEAVGLERDGDPDLHLLTEAGIRIDPVSVDDGWYRFVLPRGAATHLMSRTWVPAEHDADSDDVRVLGVCIAGLKLDERAMLLDDLRDGWQAAERSEAGTWRWTKGYARLPRAERSIAVQVTGEGRYWLHQDLALTDERESVRAA